MNYMLHFESSQRDFDRWKKLGIDMDFQQIDRYLIKSHSEGVETSSCDTVNYESEFDETVFRMQDEECCTETKEAKVKV